jgi:hypothetical protein
MTKTGRPFVPCRVRWPLQPSKSLATAETWGMPEAVLTTRKPLPDASALRLTPPWPFWAPTHNTPLWCSSVVAIKTGWPWALMS